MTTTITVGKRGTIVIPKAMRDRCQFDEGKQVDVSLENNTIVITPSVHTRTRLDENFDKMRSVLEEKGVTLEMALAKLREIKQAHG